MFTNKFLKLGYVSLVAVVLGLIISASYVNTTQAEETKKVELKIEGMGCKMCAKTIESIITHCSGVMGCAVSYKDGKATVEVEVGKMGEVVDSLEGAGYSIDLHEMGLQLPH